MEEPQEATDRRWRFNLMSAVETLAEASELSALENTELIDGFFDCVSDDCLPHGIGAMSEEELAAAQKLCREMKDLLGKARSRLAAKPLEPEDLVALGWLENVQPLALEAFRVFVRRGWLGEEARTKSELTTQS